MGADHRAEAFEGRNNTKLRVFFFGPFKGDYWVLDHAPDYYWSIVGEPSRALYLAAVGDRTLFEGKAQAY